MKKFIINLYYDFLMWLEDVFGTAEKIINDHRKVVDDKFFEKYIR